MGQDTYFTSARRSNGELLFWRSNVIRKRIMTAISVALLILFAVVFSNAYAVPPANPDIKAPPARRTTVEQSLNKIRAELNWMRTKSRDLSPVQRDEVRNKCDEVSIRLDEINFMVYEYSQ
jgi:hypothetical protein